MRTSVYTFLLLTALILTPCEVWAGTDDSGLQVFEIGGGKFTGMLPKTIIEDTGIAQSLINLIPSPEGYYSLLDFGALNANYTNIPRIYVDGTFFDNSGQSFLALEKRTALGTSEIVWYTAGGALTNEIDASASNYNSWFSAFFNSYIYIVNGDSFMRFQPSAPSPATLSKPWGISGAACIYKNRLWVAEANGTNTYLWYSSASDWSDFTVGATTGGVFNIQSISGVRKLCSTNYGLYIMCDNEIFLLSGGDVPSSWRLDKVFSGYPLGNNGSWNYYAAVIGNDVYFLTKTNALFRISGNAIELVSTMPQRWGSYITSYTSCNSLKNRFFCLTNPANTNYGIIYDLQERCWYLNTEFNYLVGGSDGYYINTGSLNTSFSLKITPNFAESDTSYGRNVIYPWRWDSAWLTLDGNSNTQKEINRIEIEYQGSTTSVNLFYATPTYQYVSTTKTFYPTFDSRITTSVWNAPVGKKPINKLFLGVQSFGEQTQKINYVIKKIRIYYRPLGSYGTLRSGY